MISYWMNNCVVVSENCMKNSIENVATDYFDDLVRKAFIQPSHIPGLYKVDDMLRDIAVHRSNACSKNKNTFSEFDWGRIFHPRKGNTQS